MSKLRHLLLIAVILLSALCSKAQVSGVKNIPGDYPTLTAAITTLNAQGVATGGATINVPAGYTETLTAGLALKYTTAASGLPNPLTIIKSGSGANPLITAQTGTSTTTDGIFTLVGADYVTINGIDLAESPTNTTATMGMEWGYGLCKSSATDGCQNVTIKNCSVTLNKTLSANNYGIYSANHTDLVNTALTITSFNGTNSYNKFYNNSIQNCYWGIYLVGFNSGAPYDLFDQNNQIGVDGTSTRRNQITNYGGLTTTAYGVNQIYQNNFKCFNTYFNNSGGTNGAHDVYGLFMGAALNANVDIYNDTLSLVSAGSTQGLYPIYNTAGSTGAGNTVNIYGNVVSSCNYTSSTSGIFYGIYNQATATYANMYNNKVINNTVNGTGTFGGIYYSGSSATLVKTVNLYGNLVDGNSKTGTGGTFYAFYASASPQTMSFYSNTLTNNSCTTTANTITFYGYYNNAAPPYEYLYNNVISNNTGGTSGLYGMFINTGSGTNKNIYLNSINSCTSTGFAYAMYSSFGAITNIYQNNIYNIVSTSTTASTPNVAGIIIATASNFVNNIHNNFISDLQAPFVSNVAAIYGVWLNGSGATISSHNFFNNSIYLNASSSGANFGTNGLVCDANVLNHDIRNNIVVNTSTANGTGLTAALRRGTAATTNYSSLSSNNCYYAGTPSATNVIFTDGTNTFSTMTTFQGFVNPREQASFTGMPPFVNSSTTPYNLHIQTTVATQCESGAQPIATLTVDYDNQTRNVTFGDVGADEFNGVTSQVAAPNIIYTPITNGPASTSRTLTAFASITAPTGINTTTGTKPRLYYKKSTDANNWVGNTSSDNSWKYVEATNSSSPFNFVINYGLLQSPVSALDVIQYFVVAQNLASTPVVGINSGSFVATPTSVNISASQFPLAGTINQYTIVGTSFSGTVNVSSTDTYTSLTNSGGIFEAINNGVLTGNLTIGINGSLTAESGSIALNQWAEDGIGGYSVSIVPTAASQRLITGTNTTQSLIRFNGADRVTIDGRFSGSGQYLTFRNQTTSAPAIGYLNDAQNNQLLYSIIESNNVNTTVNSLLGAVNIGTTSLLAGNDNITISNCELRDRSDIAGTPNVLIGCLGTNSFPAQNNHNIIISNNTIHDWYVNSGTTQNAISIGTGNSNFTISGNSFYQTSARTHTVTGSVMRAIFVSNSSAINLTGGFAILNNYIGGTAPLCGGGDMTLTVSGSTIGTVFNGLSVATGQIPSNIQGNIIRAIDFTTQSPGTAVTNFAGIATTNGVFNISGNAVGSSTTTGAIKITVNNGATQNVFLAPFFISNANGYSSVSNNTIGGITIAGTNTNNCFNQLIQVQGTPLSSQTTSITNNLVGSTSVANSIQNNSSMNMNTWGVRQVITSGAPLAITTNTFMNITDNSTNTACTNVGVLVISTVGGSAPLTVSNNVMKNHVVNATPASTAFVNSGLNITSYGGGGHTIASNTISGIYNNNSVGTANSYVAGIMCQGATLGGSISKNYIYDLRNANTGSLAGLQGMSFISSNNWTVSNNMLSVSNGTNTNNLALAGIGENIMSGGSLKLYYNSVYVGGNNGSGTSNSAAYMRGSTSDNVLRNNIFYNDRTGSSAIHAAISVTSTSGWSGTSVSNNNVLIAGDTTKLVIYGTGTLALTAYKSASGADLASKKEINTVETSTASFLNASTGDLHMNTSTFYSGAGTPISITDDIDGQSRSITAPGAGADEPSCVAPGTPTSSTPGANLAYCAGLTTTLMASAGTNTVNWYTSSSGGTSIGSGTNIITSSTLAAGTRTYYAEAVSSCTVSVSRTAIVFTVNPSPAITVNSGSICNGGTFTMTPSGGLTYTFSNGSTTVNPSTTTSYSVTGTGTNGCISSVAISTVTVNPNPTVNIAVSGSVCAGLSASLTASGASSYTWNTGATAAGITVTPSISTVYTVTGSSAVGCQSSGSQTVTVAQNPTVNISGSSGICTGQTASLTASGASTYSWNTGATTSSITSTPTTNTTYTVTGTDALGCKTTTTQLVTVAASLSISIVGPTSICIGQPANLSGNGGVTYTWNTGATSSTIAPSPTVTTTYSVIGASGTCSNTAISTISVNPNPTVTVSGTSVICAGQTTTLSGTGAISYSWNTGASTASAALSPSVNTTYSLTGLNNFGCSNTATFTVVSNSLPVISVAQSAATVCAGSPATFTASGASTYTWSTASNNNTVVITPTTSSTYTVNGTSAQGCVSSKTFAVATNSVPVLSITPSSATVCSLSQATFNASGANTYTWNGTITGQSVALTPTASTVYTLSGTNLLGCISSATVGVTTNSLPTLSIAPPALTVCALTQASFVASGASTYTWNNTLVSASIATTPSVNATYTIAGTSSQGCKTTQTVGVTVNAAPSLSISPASATVCPLTLTTFTGSGANTYTWSTVSNNTTISITPTSSATYTLNGTGSNGCVGTSTFALSVFAQPTLAISPPATTLCSGSTGFFTATGASTYTWQNTVTGATYTSATTSNTVYTVVGTSSNGCSGSATVAVTTISLPIISISPASPTICSSSPVTFTANGASTYTWNNTASGSTITLFQTSSTTHTVTGTNALGCSSTATVAVLTTPLPSVSISPSLATICAGQITTLTASGAVTYSWVTGSTVSTTTVNPITVTSYSVIGTDALGCSSSTNIVVLTNTLPPVSVAPSSATVCALSPLTLTASGAATYTWSSGGNGTTTIVNPATSLIYTVSGTDAGNGCIGSATVGVSALSLPSLSIAASNSAVCDGSSATFTVSGANTYSWVGLANTATVVVTPTAASVYTATGTNTLGCTSSETVALGFNSLPVIAVSPATTQAICPNEVASFTASGGVTYTWTPGNSSSNVFTVTPSSSINLYTVAVTDANNCTNFANVLVTLNNCVGLTKHNLSGDALGVFPNPSTGIITAQFDFEGVKLVEVYNEIGQVIETKNTESMHEQFNLSQYAKGIYFVRITSKTASGNFKIIVQ